MFRTIIWFIWFWLSLLISIPFSMRVKYLLKKNKVSEAEKLIYTCTSFWAKSLLKLAGVKVELHGIENIPKDRNVLFVGNHQGNFDIPIYISQIPELIGFISKIEIEKVPFVRTWMRYMHCVFMDRSNIRKSGEAIIKGINNLKDGKNIVIFPEGTRSKGDKLGEFKAGSFKLATKSKCPIVPITMNGSYKIMEANSKFKITPANIQFFIHPLIEVADLSKEEINELPKRVEEIISSKLPK